MMRWATYQTAPKNRTSTASRTSIAAAWPRKPRRRGARSCTHLQIGHTARATKKEIDSGSVIQIVCRSAQASASASAIPMNQVRTELRASAAGPFMRDSAARPSRAGLAGPRSAQ